MPGRSPVQAFETAIEVILMRKDGSVTTGNVITGPVTVTGKIDVRGEG